MDGRVAVADAQRDIRTVFVNGAPGQFVSGAIWFASAAAAAADSTRWAILILVVGGAFIYPLTQLVLKLSGRPTSPSPGNPLTDLARQIAFTVPLALPLAGAAALYRLEWFYPACMVIVGAHYLPFVFLYGMWQFAGLAVVLMGAAYALAFTGVGSFGTGAWITAAALIGFAGWAALVGPAPARESAESLPLQH